MKNRRWVLASHPTHEADENTWSMQSIDLPSLNAGQILVRTKWVSPDPYMRGRIVRGGGMQVGDLMQGGGVGEVVESRHSEWKVGDTVESLEIGWQEYALLTPGLAGPAQINRVDVRITEPQATLSWLGMPGLTAYFALLNVAKPLPGDVVLISAAAGAVGQVAGQIAKLMGCRVIGVVGSQDKIDWCRHLGYDDVINYRTTPDLVQAIRTTAPGGINVFFDATGGAIHDAVLKNLALNARVAVVGRIAHRPGEEDIGQRSSSLLIASRATVQGFVVYDWWHQRDEALRRLASWHKYGSLKFQEDVAHGFENIPHAYVRMMSGDNLGKQLVKV